MNVLSIREGLRRIQEHHRKIELATPFERSLADYAEWYYENIDDAFHAGVDNQLKFMQKAVSGCLHLLYLASDDMRMVAKRSREGSGLVWVPPTLEKRAAVIHDHRNLMAS